MSDLLLKSISASWLVLAVLLLRFVLKKVPKWVNVLLWGIVAVRLAFPFSIESALSLIPSAETISPGIMMDTVPSVQTGVPAINNVINPVIGNSFATAPRDSYIDAHPIEYRELTYYGSYTLQYVFSKFLEGGQTGLRGHLMRSVLDALAPEAQLRLYAETGQEYFDEWKAGAIRISEQHEMEWIKSTSLQSGFCSK